MGRTFAYCRVSTVEQTTDNQVAAIKAAGYNVEPHRVISETISGSVQVMERPAFRSMVEHKLEPGDTLVVLKLDRLGRDNIDVQQTITNLSDAGVKVVSLDLPAHDLTSSEGKLLLQMFAAFAEFERNRIRERTQEGLERAKSQGKKLGRPVATDTTEKVQQLKTQGLSQSQAAAQSGLGIATIKRHWNKSASA
ncbi:recombinase family protein [Halomonas denitrificans]|uniref:recombinase family protein n=1 Tax=Halomonas denitrificans TaxID=370769 RepID=UPI000D33BC7C|nr:recombinase family protein [Halomonas denitrificans]